MISVGNFVPMCFSAFSSSVSVDAFHTCSRPLSDPRKSRSPLHTAQLHQNKNKFEMWYLIIFRYRQQSYMYLAVNIKF